MTIYKIEEFRCANEKPSNIYYVSDEKKLKAWIKSRNMTRSTIDVNGLWVDMHIKMDEEQLEYISTSRLHLTDSTESPFPFFFPVHEDIHYIISGIGVDDNAFFRGLIL